MITRIGIILALGFGCLVGNAQTTSGELTGDEVWSGLVELTGDVTVGFGAVLTIAPGTIVSVAEGDDTESGKDDEKIELRLEGGKIFAIGTPEARIEFRSSGNTALEDQWYGIRCDLGEFEGRFLDIQNAVIGLRYERGGNYTFSDSSISRCGSSSFEIDGGGKYVFERLKFIGSLDETSSFNLWVSGSSNVDLIDCEFNGGTNGGPWHEYVRWDSSGTLFVKGTSFGDCKRCRGIRVGSSTVSIAESIFSGINGAAIVHESGNSQINVVDSQFIKNGYGIEVSAGITNLGRPYLVALSIEDSSFLGNNIGVGLGRLRAGSGGEFNFTLTGSILESNSEAGVKSLARQMQIQDISNNQIQFNGVGLSFAASIEAGIIRENDFESNSTHLEQVNDGIDYRIIANDNYWGVETTALLAAGSGPDTISAFRGPIQIDTWAESSRLVSVEPPPSPLMWDNDDWGVTVGETATIRLTLENADTFDYQWFKEGVAIEGANEAVFEISDASLSDAGTYTVVVSNEAGTVTSEPAVLSVLADTTEGPDGAQAYHPADKNQDYRISIDEVTSYGAAWKNGRTWEIGPNPIPIDYLTRAGSLWKNGETYRKESGVASAPLWWVNDTGGNPLGAYRSTITNAPGSFKPLSPWSPQPSLMLPQSDENGESSAHIVLPVGTTSWAIEGDGFREGPFWGDGQHTVSIPDDAATSPLLLSMDGLTWIAVPETMHVGGPLQAVSVSGEVGLVLPGSSGLEQLQSSSNLEDWSPATISHVDDGVIYPLRSEGSDATFYRLKSEPGHL